MRRDAHVLEDRRNGFFIKSYHSLLSPQTREYREHHHTECELSLFLSGSGIYSVHGKRYPFFAGDVFLFGSNEAHCITEIYEEMEVLNIHFEPRLLWEHAETVELLNLFAARSKEFSNRFSGDETLKQKILELELEISEQNPCCNVSCKYLLFSTFIHMIRSYPCIDPERGLSSHSVTTRSLRHSIDYIHENIERKLTLKELADVACMTPTYFSSVFRKYNGISPWEYITIKRVEKAVEMLRTTDMTKLEIAEHCGFSSASNFYKAFATVTGKKPNDFINT